MNLRLWAKRLIEAVMYLIVIAVMGGLLAMCSGCMRIPVTVYNPHTDDGKAIPVLSAPTGETVTPTGVEHHNPGLPQPDGNDYKPPAGVSLDSFMNLILLALSILSGGGIAGAAVYRGRMRRAEQNEDEVYDDLKRTKGTHDQPAS